MTETKTNNILIKNIYYMLSYAFKNLDNICQYNANCEAFDNIQDLFSVILYKGISNQVKRGLCKEYVELQDKLATVRGKININETIKTNCLSQKKLICEYDEFSENSYYNKVLKSTCLLLLRKGDIKTENKKLLKKILIYLNYVDEIDLKRITWSKISYHRNNATYKMLINICYLVVRGLLMTTDSGDIILNKFLDDQLMHTLYEKFILEYYRTEHSYLEANPSPIKWNLEEESQGIEFLPNMKSDITLTNNDKTLIIDAKFYSHSMRTYFDKTSYISSNLYQIFTYVKNKDIHNTGNVSGVLLYAKTQDEAPTQESTFNMSGNKIGIMILDLNQEFKLIKNKLDEIANRFI
jgi:5-methylcytosine-specific restriction enzyme subunit McrC